MISVDSRSLQMSSCWICEVFSLAMRKVQFLSIAEVIFNSSVECFRTKIGDDQRPPWPTEIERTVWSSQAQNDDSLRDFAALCLLSLRWADFWHARHTGSSNNRLRDRRMRQRSHRLPVEPLLQTVATASRESGQSVVGISLYSLSHASDRISTKLIDLYGRVHQKLSYIQHLVDLRNGNLSLYLTNPE